MLARDERQTHDAAEEGDEAQRRRGVERDGTRASSEHGGSGGLCGVPHGRRAAGEHQVERGRQRQQLQERERPQRQGGRAGRSCPVMAGTATRTAGFTSRATIAASHFILAGREEDGHQRRERTDDRDRLRRAGVCAAEGPRCEDDERHEQRSRRATPVGPGTLAGIGLSRQRGRFGHSGPAGYALAAAVPTFAGRSGGRAVANRRSARSAQRGYRVANSVSYQSLRLTNLKLSATLRPRRRSVPKDLA